MKQGAEVSKHRRAAFTLVELIVVIGVMSVIAVMMVPALAGVRSNSKAIQCLNNQRRLATAWLMYSADNNDRLVSPTGWVSGWMDWGTSPDNTNTIKLMDPVQSLIARYIRSADSFKCPADIYRSGVQATLKWGRVRSVALLSTMGTTSGQQDNQIAGRTYFNAAKLTDLNKPGPANTLTILDEHPDSINDSRFSFRSGLSAGNAIWLDMPASYHNSAAGVSFADGRAILKRWQDSRTLMPVGFFTLPLPPSPGNVDYVWMNDRSPYR